jgi:hypothetical protein
MGNDTGEGSKAASGYCGPGKRAVRSTGEGRLASHVLPNRDFWEAIHDQIYAKSLKSMVGAQGLEPWTR